ncbi:hypothetical protein ABPG72_021161 [Tetrahymena utriculariae]
MFKFTPFNWASSVILSKFLKPYFKELDDKQVDVGFWDGQFTLKNLELRREVFLINDLNLEVVDSLISELKITIPWKSIKTEPIQIEIKGLKLILSNKLDQTDEEKEEVKKKMHQIKMDALDQFEASYEKYNKEEQKNESNKVKKESKSSNPFYKNWIQNISQNFKLKIENIELVYIYHVTEFEVLKIGLNLDKIEIGTVDQSYQQKNSFNSILKNLNILNLSIFFEFYDSFVTTQIKTNNYFDFRGKSIGFFTKYKNANNTNTNQDPLEQIQQKQAQENENYIIKDLNLEVLIKLDLFYSFQLELNVNVPDITIFLKQNQMRLLLKSLNDLANYDPKRPIYRPNEKIPQEKVTIQTISPVKQWWQYAIVRVIDKENLPLKTKQKGFLGFFDSFKYRKIYTKKKLQIKLKETEVRFFEQFELAYPLSQLLVLRQIAINTLVRYKTFLFSDIFSEKNESEKWFQNFGNIPISKIQSLNYHFIKDQNFEKTYKNDNSENTETSLNSSNSDDTDKITEENKNDSFPIICEVHLGHFEILIEENSMLSDVKNLHQQANLFKESLSNTPHLQQQVLRHIKKNFIQELSRKGINQNSEQQILDQSEDQTHQDFQWNHANICKKKKILLCLEIENAAIIYNKLDHFVSQTQVDIKLIKCLDMHSKNKQYDNVLSIEQGVQFMIKQEIVKIQKVALKNSTEEKITHNNIDVNIPSVSLTLCKPFIERCNILMQVIFFDPEKSQEKPQAKGDNSNQKKQGGYNFEKQQQFYTYFLQQKDRVNTFTNMAINISKINVNLPLNYEVPDKLLIIQLKSLKIFKREHESLLEENMKLRDGTHEEFKTEGDILEPLLVTVHCLKILIAQDDDWELNQNIFLHNLKRVQNQVNNNEKNFYKKQVEEQTQIILETLPISVRMEKSHNTYSIGTICLLPREKKADFKKNITPSTQKLFVNLPFFLINISIAQLQTLLYLAQVWCLKGYNLLSVLQDQGGDNLQEQLPNQINELNDSREEKNGEVGKSLFGRQKTQEKKLRQIIDRNIQYEEKILQYLQEHIFFQMDLQMEGLQLNLNVCSKDIMKKYEGRLFHSNDIIQVNILNMQLHTRQFYFSNSMQISIETCLIENRNCCQYDLLTNLKHQCTHNLSKSDLQVVLKDTCPLNQDVSHFQSIIYKNRQTADKFYKKQLKKQQKQKIFNNKLGQNKKVEEKDIFQDISVDDLQSFIKELERNQKGTNTHGNNRVEIDGVVIESDNESDLNYLDENDEADMNYFGNSFDNLVNKSMPFQKENKKAKGSVEKEEEDNLIKNLMYFEDEYLLLNLKDQENATNEKLNGEQYLHRCSDCYGEDSSKKFLILNFQNRLNKKDQTNSSYSYQEASPKLNQLRNKYQNNQISEQNIQVEDSMMTGSQATRQFVSVQENGEETIQDQIPVKDIIITMESIDDEYFVAKENDYHDLVPSNIYIELNHPVITLDPLILAYLKSIIEISSIYAAQRVEDFKEYMQVKGFSPYIEEEKEDQGKVFQEEQNSEQNQKNDAINSKINSQLTLVSETITIQMLHNVPVKEKKLKNLEPAFLLYLFEFILIQQATQAYNLLTVNSSDVCLYDISEKTGLHTQTLGSFEKINNQQAKYPCNQLSIEMKTFHSKELSQIQKFSTYIGIKLEEAKIVFLKRNTMEIQVYIRQFLLAALRNRIESEDLNFIREYSKKLIYKKYDLFIEDKEFLKSFQEPVQNNLQPEPSDMKMEIVVLNSIVCAYRSSLSENDGLFVHFTKLGYWFTGKWGQEYLQNGLIETGKHYYEEQTTDSMNQNSSAKSLSSFQECKAETQTSFQDITQNISQEFESNHNIKKIYNNDINNNGIQEDDQFFDVVSEKQGNDQNINQKITQNYTQTQFKPSKNMFQFNLNTEDQLPSKISNQDLKQVKSRMHISSYTISSNNSRLDNQKQEHSSVIEIQRIFMWDLKAYSSQEFLNRDIVIMSPPDKPSVEVQIIFDDPNFSKYTGITDYQLLPMKIAVNIPELNLFLYDKDYCTLCKLFQENIAEAPRTVFINQEFDINNNNIWQFLDISVQKVNAKMFQGERVNLQEQMVKDYNYFHIDAQVDNHLSDIKYYVQANQASEMEKQDPSIYKKNQNFSNAGQVLGINQAHSQNNSQETSKQNKSKNSSKNQQDQEKEDSFKEMPVNPQHEFFLQQVYESQQIKKGKSYKKYKNIFLINNPASLSEMNLENIIYHFYMHENGCKIMKVWATKLDINDFRMCSLLKNKQVLFDIKDWQNVEEASEQYTNHQAEEKEEGNNLNKDFINFNDNNEYGFMDDNSLNSDELNINEDFDIQHGKKFGQNFIANQELQNDDSPHPEKNNQNGNLDDAIQENDAQFLSQNRVNQNIILEQDSILQESQRREIGSEEIKLRHKQEKMMKKNQKKKRKDLQNGIINRNQIQEKNKIDTDINIGENDQILDDKKRSNTNEKIIEIKVENKDGNNTQQQSFWQKISNFFCCRRKQQPQQQASQKSMVQEKPKEQIRQIQQQVPTQIELKRQLETWPQDDFPKGREWVIHNYQQCLPITIPDNQNQRLYQYNDMEQQYNLFRMNNLYNFIGSEADLEYNDLKFAFITQPDGEKLIKIHIKNKNFVFMNDFLFDLIAFFRTPFNGSDDILNKQFFRQPKQNNYPPMIIKIQAENFWALILDSLNNPSNCLAVNLNADYLQEWIGDSGMGPGSALMNINIDLKKLLTCNTDKIYQDFGQHLRTYSISTIKIIQKYLNDQENQGNKEKNPIFIDDQNLNSQNIDSSNQMQDQKSNELPAQSPKKKLAFFQKKPAIHQPPSLVKEDSQELQKEIQKVEFNTNLIIPFKVRFKNSYVINYYKLKKQYEEDQALYLENILQDLQKSQRQNSNNEKFRYLQKNGEKTPYTHQEIEISVFNKRVKKFRNLNISMYSLKQISTITSTMMNPSTYITIFKEEVNPLNNQLSESLYKVKCITDAEKALFLKYSKNQDYLKQYVPKRLTNEEIQQFQKNPEEKCIGYLRVKLKRFKLEAFKNYFGNQTMKIKISNLILKKISKGDNSSMGLKGQLKIKYYNKRKGFYEPFLEPWIFHVQNQRVDSDQNLQVCNYGDQNKENESEFKELESVLSHRNSLNINLSTAFIETAIEAKNAFGQTNQKLRPYNIVNKLGFGLLFLLGENKKIYMEDLILQIVSNNEEKEYLPHTQNVEDKGRQIKKIKNLFVNFIILKPQKEKQIQERIELYINGLATEMKRIKSNNIPQKSTIFNNKSNNYFSFTNNTNATHSSTYVIQDSIQGLDKKQSNIDSQNSNQKEQKFKQKILISKNFSDFRTINRASLDRLGKQFFQLENLNAQHFNTNKQDRNKILEKYKDIKNLLHQTDKDFFVVDVSLDSGVGRKQITLQSSVAIFNNLNQEVIVGFLKRKKSDQIIFEEDIQLFQQKSGKNKEQPDPIQQKRKYIKLDMYKIQSQQSFPIPYSFLSEKRDVFYCMVPDSDKLNINHNQNKSKNHVELIKQIVVTSDKNGVEDVEQMDQIDEEILDIKIFNIHDFVQPYSIFSDYDQVDDLKLNDIIGKPCLEFENERFGRLILRQNFELKQNKFIQEINSHYSSIFQINVIKTKWPVQNISEKSQMYCYETSIILNPFLRIINQAIQDIQIIVGDQDKKLAPGETFIPFNVDFVKAQSILVYKEPSNKIEFNPFTKKLKDFVKLEPSQSSDQIYPLCLSLEYTKISKQSRVVVIYCPYIIFNRTGLDLYYKEDQKDLQVKKNHFEKKKVNGENKPNFPNENSRLSINQAQKESLQMFSPSNKFKKLSIGIFYKSPQTINWSQSISFTQKNHVGIQLTSDNNNLYEVNVNLSQGVGDLSKTEMITITPKYYFYNQTEHTIIVSQKVPIMQDTVFQLDQGQIQPFFWMQKDGQQIIYLSFFQDIKNPKFSNPFKIDEINTFAVKVPYKDESQQQQFNNLNGVDNKYKYKLITISITQMNGVFCVRFLEKGQPPPYVIFNKTNHEIFVQQYIPEFVKTCCSKKRNQLTSEKKVIFPKQRIVFTWDHWNIDFDKQLSVEIDTNQKTYNLEKLKDYEPIYLQKIDERGMQKDSDPKKKILYKKGYLLVCDNFKDQFEKYFCILNIYKQKLKLYINKEKISTIDLVYAKLEISREGFDIITIKQKRLNIKQAEDSKKNSLFDWYISIYNSIQVNMPDKVDFKIEPRNGTMEITFYQQKKYFENDKGNNSNSQKGFLDLDEDGVPYQVDHLNYQFNIKNMIGISIIDDMTQELFSISLKNLSLVYQVVQKWIKEDDEIDIAYNQQQAEQKNQDQLEIMQQVQSQKRQIIKHVTKSFFQFSLENIFINNQDISKSQYPVIFASDTKKTGEKPPPFIFISTQWKNVKNIYEEEQIVKQEQIQQMNTDMEKSAVQLSNRLDQQDNKQDNKKYGELQRDEKVQLYQKSGVFTKASTLQKYRTVSLDNENQDDIDNASAVQGDQSAQQVVQWINNLQIYFDHFEIRIDQQIIQTIMGFNTQLSQALYSDNETKSQEIYDILEKLKQKTIDKILLDNIESGVENMKKAIYIKNLSIQPINFCLTLNLAGADNALGSDIFSVPLAIFQEFGLELVAIDQASISLNALNQQHLYDTFSSIQSRIQKHYISQFLTEIYKIFGSFEAIGNPVKLVKNISSSVSKMIYNPLKSLQQGRGAQAVGDLATGAISLVQNSISSIYKAARNISGFIMRVISKITFHKQYLQDRSIRVNRQIKNIKDGFQIGCKNFLLILWDTIYGIIYIPLEGCKKKHIFGLIKGIYTAFVSIFIKPTVGIYDFLISIFDGLVNSAIYEEHIMEYRSRPPRIFETQKITNFEYKNAIGKDILLRVKQQPKSYESIKYYDQIQVSKNKFVEIVLTDLRLVCAQKNSSVDYQKVQLHKIKYIEYNQKKKYFRFFYDVPVKNILKCCNRNNIQTKIRYEKFDNQEKANEMIRYLQEHYKQQKIPIKINIKNG